MKRRLVDRISKSFFSVDERENLFRDIRLLATNDKSMKFCKRKGYFLTKFKSIFLM